MIGVVLTGGASTRMGRDKALLPVGGVAMAVRVALALVEAGAERVVCIGGDEAELRAADLEVVPDEHPGQGPLGAIVVALPLAGDDEVVVVAPCDLVTPDPAALAALAAALLGADGADAAVPLVDGRLFPLPSAWRSSAGPAVRASFGAGERSPARVLDGLDVVVVSLPAAGVADADSPDELPPGAGSPDQGDG